MSDIGGRIGEAHFQLAGHLLGLDEVHEIGAGRFRPGQHIKILPLLYTGQGRAGDIAGEISAAAHGDNPMVQCFLHHITHGVLIQIMELNGLASGQMDPGHGVANQHIRNERHFLLAHPACRHPQAQHAGLSVLLGIAAIKSGKSLIGSLVQRTGVKLRRLFPKRGQILFPGLWIDGMHLIALSFLFIYLSIGGIILSC